MITSFLNNFAIIEPYERKVYHLDLHNYISQVEKKERIVQENTRYDVSNQSFLLYSH